jgi:small-conductance mechanosensitive channel
LAVGLAAKDTLSNMISGFTLIIDSNLRPGDRINLGGLVGDVEEVGLRSTLILGTDGNRIIVPNADLVTTKIINFSMPDRRGRVASVLKFPLDAPYAKIEASILEVVAGLTKVAPLPAPGVGLVALQDGAQVVEVAFWVQDLGDAGGAQTAFHRQLLEKLSSRGIALWVPPVPGAES